MDSMKDVMEAAEFVRNKSADIDEEEQRLLEFVIDNIVDLVHQSDVAPCADYGCVENAITIRNNGYGETVGMRIKVDPDGKLVGDVSCIVPAATYARVFGLYDITHSSKYISRQYDLLFINICSHRAKAELLKALSARDVLLVYAMQFTSATAMLRSEQEYADKENQQAIHDASESRTKLLKQLKAWINKLRFFVSDDGLPMVELYFPREVIFYAKDYLSDLGMSMIAKNPVIAYKGEYFLRMVQPAEKDPLWKVLYELRDAANTRANPGFIKTGGPRGM